MSNGCAGPGERFSIRCRVVWDLEVLLPDNELRDLGEEEPPEGGWERLFVMVDMGECVGERFDMDVGIADEKGRWLR